MAPERARGEVIKGLREYIPRPMSVLITGMKVWWLLALVLMLVTGGLPQSRVLKAEDRVRVTCEEEPTLNRDYTVTRDGLLIMSFIGAIRVAGLTEQEAADRIEDELVKQRIVPRATVTVTLLASDSGIVRFSGAVEKPGEAPWREGMRLKDVIDLAKPTNAADLQNVRIERRAGPVLNVNWTKFDPEAPATNPELLAGDFIFFPLATRSDEVFVLGAVARPGAIRFQPGLTVAKAIEQAGGLLPRANPLRVRLERAGAETVVARVEELSPRSLQSGDRIVVELVGARETITVLGGVRTPGTVGWHTGMTLVQAIRAAGGFADGVRPGRVKLIRSVNGRAVTRNVDVKPILDGFQGDVPLLVGDRIEVPTPRRRRDDSLLIAVGAALFFFFGR